MAVKPTPSILDGKGICHMTGSTMTRFERPSEFSPDPLAAVIGAGAGELPGAAGLLAGHEHLVDEQGRGRVVRHGTPPEREVMTGTGRVPVEVPRVRGRKAGVADGGGIGFRSSIVPPCTGKGEVGLGPAAPAVFRGHPAG